MGILQAFEYTLDGMDILFSEAIGLGLMMATIYMYEAIFVSEGVPFFAAKELPIVGEHFLWVTLKANNSAK